MQKHRMATSVNYVMINLLAVYCHFKCLKCPALVSCLSSFLSFYWSCYKQS